MLNCIIETMRPKARMKWPSTPVSFIRRSTISASSEVRISINRRLASGFSRSSWFTSLSERVTLRIASGWKARLFFCARRKILTMLTGSCLNTSGAARLMRLLSTMKSSESGTRRRGLGLLVFQLGAEDGGEVADFLGDQEVVLHEALDVLHARMRGIAEANRELALQVEGEPLLGPPCDKVQIAAHRPEEIGAAPERAVFLRVEHAALQQLLR